MKSGAMLSIVAILLLPAIVAVLLLAGRPSESPPRKDIVGSESPPAREDIVRPESPPPPRASGPRLAWRPKPALPVVAGPRLQFFPIKLLSLSAPDPNDKRTWVVQIAVYVKREGKIKCFSRWPTLANPAIQDTDYELIDMEYQEEEIQSRPFLRKRISITLQNTKHPNQPFVVLNPQGRVPRPEDKTSLRIIELGTGMEFPVRKGSFFGFSNMQSGEIHRYKVVNDDPQSVQAAEADAQGTVLGEPFTVPRLTAEERQWLERRKQESGKQTTD